MFPDPVVEEIRKTREQLAARFRYDIEALARYARERDAADGRPVVRLPPRRPQSEQSQEQEPVAVNPA